MDRYKSPRILLPLWLFFFGGVCWGLPFVLGPNSGQINFSVKPVGPGSPVSVFGPGGQLVCPGAGFPCLGAAIPPVQSVPPAPGLISPPLTGVAVPGLIDAGLFGGAATTLTATPFPGGAGVFWTTGFVFDVNIDGFASVNDSNGTGTFTNIGAPFIGFGGGVLGVTGALGGPNSFVAASLTGTIGGVPFVPIVIAANGAGATLATAGTTSGFFPGPGGTFSAFGLSIIPGAFTVPTGGSITLSGTLSLVADPFSSVVFDLNVPGIPQQLPDLIVQGGTVPEPGSAFLFGAGLFLMILGGVNRQVMSRLSR